MKACCLETYNEGYNRGLEYKEQEIIKLLEGYFRPEEAKAIYPADYEQYLDIVALIKGENK